MAGRVRSDRKMDPKMGCRITICGSDGVVDNDCDTCGGSNLHFFSAVNFDGKEYEIQRCDLCKLHASDHEAAIASGAEFRVANGGEVGDIYVIVSCPKGSLLDRRNRQLVRRGRAGLLTPDTPCPLVGATPPAGITSQGWCRDE